MRPGALRPIGVSEGPKGLLGISNGICLGLKGVPISLFWGLCIYYLNTWSHQVLWLVKPHFRSVGVRSGDDIVGAWRDFAKRFVVQ